MVWVLLFFAVLICINIEEKKYGLDDFGCSREGSELSMPPSRRAKTQEGYEMKL